MKRLPWKNIAQHSARLAGAVAGLLFVQLALGLYYWVPEMAPVIAATPVIETLVIAVLLLARSLWKPSSRPAKALALFLDVVVALVVFCSLILGAAQGFTVLEFGWDMSIVVDMKYVPELFRMIYANESLLIAVLYTVALGVAVLTVLAVCFVAPRSVYRIAHHKIERLAVLAVMVMYAAIAIPVAGLNGPISGRMLEQFDMLLNTKARMDEVAGRLEQEAPKLEGKNPFVKMKNPPSVLIFLIESYGKVLYENAHEYPDFPAALEERHQDLEDAGFAVKSRYMISSVFGSGSWMAMASLMCGIHVGSNKKYWAIINTKNLRCMPALMNDAGYFTYYVAANTTNVGKNWRKVLFPFDTLFMGRKIKYKGGKFGWSRIPDQYVIAKAHEHALGVKRDEPTFALIVLTNSHYPWTHIPPFLDWDEATADLGAVYLEKRGLELGSGFVSAEADAAKLGFAKGIEYSLKVVTDYLKRNPPDPNTLIFIMGDHQPRKPVAYRKPNSREAIVHVLSRDPELVERFGHLGYVPGMIPQDAKEPVRFEGFLKHLFVAFSL